MKTSPQEQLKNGVKFRTTRKSHCTLPSVFGFKDWFNQRFADLCFMHDMMYETKVNRKEADCWVASHIMLRGYPFLAFLTYISVRLIGWMHYNDSD
jgi:hypothetical protein